MPNFSAICRLCLSILIASVQLLSIVSVIEAAVCSNLGELIAPCTCANNLIHCDQIQTERELRKAFQRLSTELARQKVRPIFDEFKLVGSRLEKLGADGDDILGGVQFRKISIVRNSKLKRIDPDAFEPAHNVTAELAFEDNELLGGNELDGRSLFETIRKFSNSLQTLHLTDSAIRMIPDRAFGSGSDGEKMTKLKELFLAENQIERIGDNAFTGLDQVELINLDGNQISKLGPKSFEMTSTSSESKSDSTDTSTGTVPLLRIFMRSNRLTTESFLNATPGLFGRLRRRVYLNLNLNQLTSLPRAIFWPLFHRRSALTVARNPLKCDCDFSWLLTEQLLYNSSNPTADYLLRDYQCVVVNGPSQAPASPESETIITEVDFDDFVHCKSTNQDGGTGATAAAAANNQNDDQELRLRCRNQRFDGEVEFDYDDNDYQACLNQAPDSITQTVQFRPILAIALFWWFLLAVFAA